LADKLVKADTSLGSLDPKTLKTAIDKYNASIGKRSEVIGNPTVSD
jgi:hypothetical protein